MSNVCVRTCSYLGDQYTRQKNWNCSFPNGDGERSSIGARIVRPAFRTANSSRRPSLDDFFWETATNDPRTTRPIAAAYGLQHLTMAELMEREPEARAATERNAVGYLGATTSSIIDHRRPKTHQRRAATVAPRPVARDVQFISPPALIGQLRPHSPQAMETPV